MIPQLTLGTILVFVVGYWLGRKFGWWPSFLPG